MISLELSFQIQEKYVLKVEGPDHLTFLHGQLPNNIKDLPANEFQMGARLNRTGRLLAMFLCLKKEDSVWLLLEDEEAARALEEDLNKYIIMEDVTLTQVNKSFSFEVKKTGDGFKGIYCSLPGIISEGENSNKTDHRKTYGWPIWKTDVFPDQLINETRLLELAVDFKKGCYLGQETVAKIDSRRGAAFYPMRVLLKSEIGDGQDLFFEGNKIGKNNYKCDGWNSVQLKREFRVVGKEFSFGKVLALPQVHDFQSLSEAFYDQAMTAFHADQNEQAEAYFKKAIEWNPEYSDAYESLGALYGRIERFDEALKLMDDLEKLDPKSVMAHTNKSMFLMKQGKIEEAEAEKAKATLKSFQYYGDQAKEKKAKEEKRQEELEELARRRGMFEQVLEIDEDDPMANYGLGEIYTSEGLFDLAEKHLKKALNTDPKYSVAYLALGTLYKKKNDLTRAKITFEKGIEVASSQGDLMPANSMQELLNQL